MKLNIKDHLTINYKPMYKMKIITLLLLVSLFSKPVTAQKTSTTAKFGHALNLGLGVGGYYNRGYYGYLGRSLPVLNINYEFDVAKNFTLAPSISFYSYKNSYYWGNKNYPYRYYTYKETVIPIGLKGTYYFDQLVRAGSKWDFYLAGSLGFAVVRTSWDNDYYGDRDYYRSGNPLFLDLHLGAEYHLNSKIGLFLDLSTGVSTLGLAIH